MGKKSGFSREYLSDQINLLKINEISAKSALVLGLRSVFLWAKKVVLRKISI